MRALLAFLDRDGTAAIALALIIVAVVVLA
jgi:hypothetical protein